MNAKTLVIQLVAIPMIIAATGFATSGAAEATGDAAGMAALANYGFGGVMTAALGYALWGLYRAHNEERKTWLEKWETHFQRLLDTLRESDKARHELAEEVRAHLREHDSLNDDVRATLNRIAAALDRRSP